MSAQSMLSKAFNKLSTLFYAQSELPELPVRREMEKEGWHFDVHVSMFPMIVLPPLEVARTPDGRPAIGFSASDEDRKFFQDTVAQKRSLLNLGL